ncbi:kinase-like protein [Anaeromyces robustus]|uniref:Kinase-like protein n=1 Tax=Anaeromyces robustus TaxID=1754192 RepID=A0A1Y1X713_9FUNG|nr:kinase-like protein [Anaeromyces robustus]|eukprot:ORX81551.1 kinase-like protein [Anaeromyces robustus]
MEEYSLRKNIHPRIITLHDAFFYHPSPPENENEDENENENEKSVAKITKSQTFASNIKLKFKNLNKVLKVGKKKKRKEKGKEKEKDIDNNKNQNNEEKIVEDEQQQLQEEEKQQQIQQNQQPQQPQQQDDQQQQPQQDEQQQQQQQQDEFILVTESLGKGSMDLYDYIETIGPIPEDNVRYIFAQIIEAVYFMSKNGFSHGDIKDENILIEPSTFRIKLIDFGSATTNIEHAEIPYIKFRGTRKYQAPNIYNKDTFDPLAQDVWSLGVMFFVMLFAADPFTSPEEAASVDILEQLHENIQYIRVEKGMDVSEEAIDLIMKMLEKDETARITLEEIIYHPFFRI